MAKGIRSKRLQKFKAMKRETVKKTIDAERLANLGILPISKKNAFLHPNDPEAVFPQRRPKIGMDFRSDAIAPTETLVKSKKIFNQRIPYEKPEQMIGREPEAPEIYLGELGATLKGIEKNFNKKNAMKLD
ncbi:hypothetical protein SteCoe_35458 [Stentor coeruleus]|uniref:Uncharacterized protein n=1 Tax=Stentor coeruleus TaxID=5963 RepID=A0A1R2ASL3_9CILI|nr:hypothetical protein SteCoe_35458 [Stentor coeruleus]